MEEKISINFHASSVLPYFIDNFGKIFFVLEQKDSNYIHPYFNNALNFIGGNFQKGINKDISPEETLDRELKEEFWVIEEEDESLNTILGEDSENNNKLNNDVLNNETYDPIEITRINEIAEILIKEKQNFSCYLISTNPPLTQKPLTYLSSPFLRKLSESEFKTMKNLIKFFNGKLTPDNLKWGSKIIIISLDEIVSKKPIFSWTYDQILKHLIKNYFKIDEEISIKNHDLINIKKQINDPPKTYYDFEKQGFIYNKVNKS